MTKTEKFLCIMWLGLTLWATHDLVVKQNLDSAFGVLACGCIFLYGVKHWLANEPIN